jgi:hypothetical protein
MRGGWKNHWAGVLRMYDGDEKQARAYVTKEQRAKKLLSDCAKERKKRQKP